MQEDRTELVTWLLFFYFFQTAMPRTQETRLRWWGKRKIGAASKGQPPRDGGRAGAGGGGLSLCSGEEPAGR